MNSTPSSHSFSHGTHMAYHVLRPAQIMHKACVVFCGGFMSDMQGSKALALETYCATHHITFIRFDYFGHGASSGRFENGTISHWKQDVLGVIDQLTDRPVILVGSSMGGWLMLLAALARPGRIAGLLGIASAPDFTHRLMWPQFSTMQQTTLQQEGVLMVENDYDAPYPITRNLIEDGRNNLLLHAPNLPIRCPMRLVHGMQDADVPFSFSQLILEKVMSDNAQLTLLKNGDHRLSDHEGLCAITHALEELLRCAS